MYSDVNASRSAKRTLDYNERKLQENAARLIATFNYWPDASDLGRTEKLQRLHDLSIRNERSEARTAHISLNFHPDDTLSDRKMRIIAADFLKQIDFGPQPALIYRHLDAGHPHLHIVSTNIRPDGTRISNDKRAPHILQRICHALEQAHQLTPVADHRLQQRLPSTPAAKLRYGQVPTRTSIEQVLQNVLPRFIYTSLDRLNALLRNYNVMADPGKPGSRLYENKGLYYRALDDNGRRISAPIKASALTDKPTLPYLEDRFILNRQLLTASLAATRTPLEFALAGRPDSMEELRNDLETDHGIKIMPFPTGFYYINWRTHTVCTDLDLGLNDRSVALLRELSLQRTPWQKKLTEELTQGQSLRYHSTRH